MTGLYVDTSGLARVMLDQPGAGTTRLALEAFDHRLSSRLLGIELRRVASRSGFPDRPEALLASVALVPIDDAVMAMAEVVEPRDVGTLDAVHLATALLLAEEGLVDTMLTYDLRLAEGARAHGLVVLSPAA